MTRVNRPYKDFRYGYVVDFADIRKEFDKTNAAYFKELQNELGDEFENYANLFKEPEELNKDIQNIKEKLFMFDTENLENFTKQINQLPKQELYDIRKALNNYKILYNAVKMYGYENMTEKIDIFKVSKLLNEVTNRINILNLTENLISREHSSDLLNIAMDNIEFKFKKISENELVIADKYRNVLERTRKELIKNNDKKDPEFINLYQELKRIFAKKHIEELTADEMKENIELFENIRQKVKQKNVKDEMLMIKYENDVKFMRIHKRIKEVNLNGVSDLVINKLLLYIKHEIDKILLRNYKIIDNEAYFYSNIASIIAKITLKNNIKLTIKQIQFITNNILEEYEQERKIAS